MNNFGIAVMRGLAAEILEPYRTDEERRAFMQYLGVTPTLRYQAHVSDAKSLLEFQQTLSPKLTPGQFAEVSMSYLMTQQYRRRPPYPCPCY